MSIAGFDRPRFEAAMKERLSPTTPIRSPEFLQGRKKKLEDIRRAFVADGRHIFIYGDRGVGKTSLAQTAAFEHQSADQKPILLTCDPASGFYRTARDLVVALIHTDPTATKRTITSKVSTGWAPILSAEVQKAVEQGAVPEIDSINEASAIVDFAARRNSRAPVIVIDEFERIKDQNERMLFADFIKQIGDQTIPIKTIFCGVGSSLDELLDSHHSCYRYLTSIGLERLGFDPLLAIIDNALEVYGLHMDDTTRYRIAKISDGFPHFVHLVCEKLFWEVFQAEEVLATVRSIDFVNAVTAAVQDIEAHLRAAYEKATKKYNDDYEEVLWAVADDKMLSRRSADIFQSYQRVVGTRSGRTILTRERFNQRMNALKKPAAGNILKANRSGWYEFSENILRGYVRLRAQEKGVELDVDHPGLGRKFPTPRIAGF